MSFSDGCGGRIPEESVITVTSKLLVVSVELFPNPVVAERASLAAIFAWQNFGIYMLMQRLHVCPVEVDSLHDFRLQERANASVDIIVQAGLIDDVDRSETRRECVLDCVNEHLEENENDCEKRRGGVATVYSSNGPIAWRICSGIRTGVLSICSSNISRKDR